MKKKVVLCHVHLQKFIWIVFTSSSPNLRNCQLESHINFDVCHINVILNLSTVLEKKTVIQVKGWAFMYGCEITWITLITTTVFLNKIFNF